MENIIECQNLTHHYGNKKIYENLNFSVKKGRVVGLLGKNGVGKSTTINILMGFLKPSSGECKIYNQNANELDNATKAKIGLLYEGHVCYDFLTIQQVERLHAAHYKDRWKKELYYELISKMGVSLNQKLHTLSCGQRSQVVLGLIFAQDPELLILDDYSIGLDTGYRRLFVEYLAEFIKGGNRSVLLTSHIVSDLVHLIDDIVVLRKDKEPYCDTLANFRQNFKGYSLPKDTDISNIKDIQTSLNLKEQTQIFGFFTNAPQNAKELNLDFEEAFLGLVGRY
ncbi:methyltransferase [Campylobacter mucosalis]|uniref:ABC transporter, ATP-binding protein n=1 Tax=Campylobacter mucosalis CCUG 21559 TaxID=1032067 RepID=A0A6G5QHS1_9BACT|nr:ABC transporter ATP-binding protein [Campylobacter mucosalis]KEA46468.1 methyltransferase [Campylobacter mucosalis]QCD45127.1 ABC transporter, ATP-binding protein [Campylobacter mucosalis CCUG 21559]QKF63043.1 ABC transporter, ATP-binding protein [Campylobacter mucosalis]